MPWWTVTTTNCEALPRYIGFWGRLRRQPIPQFWTILTSGIFYSLRCYNKVDLLSPFHFIMAESLSSLFSRPFGSFGKKGSSESFEGRLSSLDSIVGMVKFSIASLVVRLLHFRGTFTNLISFKWIERVFSYRVLSTLCFLLLFSLHAFLSLWAGGGFLSMMGFFVFS